MRNAEESAAIRILKDAGLLPTNNMERIKRCIQRTLKRLTQRRERQ